jgi:hypothetical protein
VVFPHGRTDGYAEGMEYAPSVDGGDGGGRGGSLDSPGSVGGAGGMYLAPVDDYDRARGGGGAGRAGVTRSYSAPAHPPAASSTLRPATGSLPAWSASAAPPAQARPAVAAPVRSSSDGAGAPGASGTGRGARPAAVEDTGPLSSGSMAISMVGGAFPGRQAAIAGGGSGLSGYDDLAPPATVAAAPPASAPAPPPAHPPQHARVTQPAPASVGGRSAASVAGMDVESATPREGAGTMQAQLAAKVRKQAAELTAATVAVANAQAYSHTVERRLLEVVPDHPIPVSPAHLGQPVSTLSRLAVTAAAALVGHGSGAAALSASMIGHGGGGSGGGSAGGGGASGGLSGGTGGEGRLSAGGTGLTARGASLLSSANAAHRKEVADAADTIKRLERSVSRAVVRSPRGRPRLQATLPVRMCPAMRPTRAQQADGEPHPPIAHSTRPICPPPLGPPSAAERGARAGGRCAAPTPREPRCGGRQRAGARAHGAAVRGHAAAGEFG